MKVPFSLRTLFVLVTVGLAAAPWFSQQQVAVAENPSAQAATPPRDYRFDKTISREVLENYLSRSISMEGVFNGRGDLDDNIRMLKSIGAKYIGRSLCLWNGEANFLHNIEWAKQQVPKALAADPDLILEACVFETVSPEWSKFRFRIGSSPRWASRSRTGISLMRT